MKKFSSDLFFAFAVVFLIGCITNGSLFISHGSALATFFYVAGHIICFISYIGAGVFFFALDKNNPSSLEDSIKKQKIFFGFIIFFKLLFAFITCVSSMNAAANAPLLASDAVIFFFIARFAVFPFISFIIFSYAYSHYVLPFFVCEKLLKGFDVSNLAEGGEFAPVAPDSLILVNKKAVLFKNIMCLIPFKQISELSKKELKLFGRVLETDIIIKTHEGKKFVFASKDFDALNEFVKKVQY